MNSLEDVPFRVEVYVTVEGREHQVAMKPGTSTLPTSSLKPLLRESVQNVVDRLAGAPMVLSVGGQLKQYFQIEYPRWKFRVVGSRIVAEK